MVATSYRQYCELNRQRRTRQDLVMLQEHKAGEELFVDYAGQTVPVHDAESGQTRAAQVFEAMLRTSS